MVPCLASKTEPLAKVKLKVEPRNLARLLPRLIRSYGTLTFPSSKMPLVAAMVRMGYLVPSSARSTAVIRC